MSLFRKRENKADPSAASKVDIDLKEITQNLYKQNLELSVKNKTLSLLRELYRLSISALDPESLGKEIVKTVRESLEFELAAIFLIKDEKLVPLAFSSSERLKAGEGKAGISLGDFSIPLESKSSFLNGIVGNKMPYHDPGLSDIWESYISKSVLKTFTDEAHIKTTAGYPLIAEDKLLGILLFCLNREFESLPQYEKDSIAIFANVIGVALNTALLYKEVRITNDKLAQANSGQEQFLHFLSHEVKGYLTNNEAAFDSIITGDYGSISEEMKKMVSEALKRNRMGANTVQDILRSADLKSGKVAYKRDTFNIADELKKLADGLAIDAKEKGLDLSLNIGKGNFEIVGDKDQLVTHVIKNLIENSIHYTPKGSISISLERKSGSILFSIKDTGVGITPEDKKRLFTEGGRGANSVKLNVHSTGHGLFIAKSIIEAHNGRIWAESEGEGKGSIFCVELPVAQ